MSAIDQVISVIKKRADYECFQDSAEEAEKEGGYLCVDDWCGSNVDDAFKLGRDQGEILFARRLLEILDS